MHSRSLIRKLSVALAAALTALSLGAAPAALADTQAPPRSDAAVSALLRAPATQPGSPAHDVFVKQGIERPVIVRPFVYMK